MAGLVPASLAVATWSEVGGSSVVSGLVEGSLGRAGRGWLGREVFQPLAVCVTL